VQRSADPGDRRRVLIIPTPGPAPGAGDAFTELGKDMEAVIARYDEHELSVIADYVRDTVEVLERQTRRLAAA
jgi:DNA-binding MarR family transcriptional regulator